jgi:hypothetical protein
MSYDQHHARRRPRVLAVYHGELRRLQDPEQVDVINRIAMCFRRPLRNRLEFFGKRFLRLYDAGDIE